MTKIRAQVVIKITLGLMSGIIDFSIASDKSLPIIKISSFFKLNCYNLQIRSPTATAFLVAPSRDALAGR